ncbi:MAG: septum site-determining protein MinC [Clostridiales bacterium]|jgi:septum site-determining protein MinC|nr:septum site-determining protein MinC [Clostridiales bacterium]
MAGLGAEMTQENSVIFKGRKNGITVVLDPAANFEVIKKTLYDKVVDAKGFFGTAKTAISFIGREMDETQVAELLGIISKTSALSISFVTSEGEEKIIDPPKNVPGAESKAGKKTPKTMDKALLSADENITTYHRGSLRSGQSIRFVGSVVVIGDINPGAEIVAEGNIVVMGSVKGMVHAGCSGNPDCFVAALDLQPTQLRLSDIITYIPKQISKKSKDIPSYAYLAEGQIYVVPLSQ